MNGVLHMSIYFRGSIDVGLRPACKRCQSIANSA
jgi:hypothetical protein